MGTGLVKVNAQGTYNIQQGGGGGLGGGVVALVPLGGRNSQGVMGTGGAPPLPSAAGPGVRQHEPSVLHVMVEVVAVSDSSERAERGGGGQVKGGRRVSRGLREGG